MVKKTLAGVTWLDANQRKQALDLINAKVEPGTYASVQRWLDQCYTSPGRIEQIMKALDEVCETYGVEALWAASTRRTLWYDRNHEPIAEYLNTGDMYAATLIYRYDLRKFQVTCVGDLIEMFERQGYQLQG
jgi:hypothetical protein